MRLETVTYECDWCKVRQPAEYPGGYSGDDEYPKGWTEIEHNTMCPDCQKARADALSYARHRRLNGWPLVFDETKPMVQSGEGEGAKSND
jgi:hypothetical protein